MAVTGYFKRSERFQGHNAPPPFVIAITYPEDAQRWTFRPHFPTLKRSWLWLNIRHFGKKLTEPLTE